MKFDELFNKIMNKFDVVTEDAEDIYDPESAGEPDPVEPTASDLEQSQPERIGLGQTDEPEEEIQNLIQQKAADEESRLTNEMKFLASEIKRIEANYKRDNKLAADTDDLMKKRELQIATISELNKINELKGKYAELEHDINNIKQAQELDHTKININPDKTSEGKKEEKPKEKDDKKEDKKEEKSEKKEEKKEDKKDEPKEDVKKESTEVPKDSKEVLTEGKKPMGTEFYLTEMDK